MRDKTACKISTGDITMAIAWQFGRRGQALASENRVRKMSANTTFIINPASDSGRTRKKLRSITKEIYAQNRQAKIALTRHALHAISLTREAVKLGAKRIVVVGGDGTLNEAINGFFDKDGKILNHKTSLAIIPSGTGSDFARSIEHKKDMRDAINFALNGKAKPTDVGMVEARDSNGLRVKRYFMNVSSVGLSGLVAGFMKTVTKKFGGKTAYFLATLQAIRAQKPPTLLISSEGMEITLENCSLVSLANGKFFGSGMKIAPNAELDDGKLDLITVQNLGAMFFLRSGYRVYLGTHLELADVHAYQTSEVLVHALTQEPVYVEVDGELFAELPARYSVMHNAVSMVR